MKYMTPELLTRFRSAEDAVAEPAAAEWEQRGVEYRARVKELWPTLPGGTRRLLRKYTLHDARLLTMADGGGKYFSIFVELNAPADAAERYIELRYRLAGGGKGLSFTQHDDLEGDGRAFGWCMYDEIDTKEGQEGVFTHAILFTGGWEARIDFFAMQCRKVAFLYQPANSEGVLEPKAGELAQQLRRLAGQTV